MPTNLTVMDLLGSLQNLSFLHCKSIVWDSITGICLGVSLIWCIPGFLVLSQLQLHLHIPVFFLLKNSLNEFPCFDDKSVPS